MEGEDVSVPPEYKKLKKSQCTPLFMVAYRERNAGACIHTHSTNAVMATLLWPGKEFRITHQEMIKVRLSILELTLNVMIFSHDFYFHIVRESTIRISNVIWDSTRNLLCPSSKTLHSRRISRRASTLPSKLIQVQQLFSCDDMAFMYGARAGNRLRRNANATIIYFKLQLTWRSAVWVRMKFRWIIVNDI